MKRTSSLLQGALASALFFAALPALGQNNTAYGDGALHSNTSGFWNTANGYRSLYSNTTGNFNTANGSFALLSNTTGNNNVGLGVQSLFTNATGSNNVAVGYNSLYQNTGKRNIGIGYSAGYNLTSGTNNIAIGYSAGYNLTSGNYNIAIGNIGVAKESGAIRIGTTGTQTSAYIAGINGATSSSGVAVYINANGQLGTITSSRRFKNDIKTMGTVSEKLLQLRPVTFRYKTADETGAHPVQYGLIAEEVAKVFPDLVQYDKAGKPFTVRYHLLTPMLLNELQKEKSTRKAETTTLKAAYNAKISTLEAKLASMEQAQAAQQKLLNQLAAYVQNGKKNVTPEKANFVQH